MKKTIVLFLALLFIALSGEMMAQGRDGRFSDGLTRNALPGLGLTQQGDSLHYVGRFILRNTNFTPFDSLGFFFAFQDSLRYQFVVRAGSSLQAGDTATCFIGTNAGKYYAQATGAGVDYLPWHVILTATGGDAQHAQWIDLYVRVWKVGTEAPYQFDNGKTSASTIDKMLIFPKAYD